MAMHLHCRAQAEETMLRSLLEDPNYLKFSWLLGGSLTDTADMMKCQKYRYKPTRETVYTSGTQGLCLIFPLHFKVTKITSFTSKLKTVLTRTKDFRVVQLFWPLGNFWQYRQLSVHSSHKQLLEALKTTAYGQLGNTSKIKAVVISGESFAFNQSQSNARAKIFDAIFHYDFFLYKE